MNDYERIIAEIGMVSVVEYRPARREILIDSNLTLEELKAIVWWVENRPNDPIPSDDAPGAT